MKYSSSGFFEGHGFKLFYNPIFSFFSYYHWVDFLNGYNVKLSGWATITEKL